MTVDRLCVIPLFLHCMRGMTTDMMTTDMMTTNMMKTGAMTTGATERLKSNDPFPDGPYRGGVW